MEIIENINAKVIRFDIQPSDLWWERSTLPDDENFTCHIQELSEEGAKDIYLSLRTLLKMVIKAQQERDHVQYEWKFPTTNCCSTRRPRENTVQQFLGNNLRITCKPGFGCQKEKEPSEVSK